jgi:hypothetical protein
MKKICPKCGKEWDGYHDESASNHFCKEHWRILLADTQCPYRIKGDVHFCSKKESSEDNPYCSLTNCFIKEV